MNNPLKQLDSFLSAPLLYSTKLDTVNWAKNESQCNIWNLVYCDVIRKVYRTRPNWARKVRKMILFIGGPVDWDKLFEWDNVPLPIGTCLLEWLRMDQLNGGTNWLGGTSWLWRDQFNGGAGEGGSCHHQMISLQEIYGLYGLGHILLEMNWDVTMTDGRTNNKGR